MLHRRLEPGTVLTQVIDVRSHEGHLFRASRRGERLNRVVQRALAEIAAITGVRPISDELHFIGLDFLDARADLAGEGLTPSRAIVSIPARTEAASTTVESTPPE